MTKSDLYRAKADLQEINDQFSFDDLAADGR